MSTGGEVCAETDSEKEKLARQAKTDQLHNSTVRNHLENPKLNKLNSLLPSCEKWRLVLPFDLLAGRRADLSS